MDILRLDTHLQQRHGFHNWSDSDDYKRAHDDNKVLDPAAKTGPVADLDTIMDGFYRFLMSMPGGDMDDWKLRAVTEVKLQRDPDMFVSLYCVSRFISSVNDYAVTYRV